MSQFVYFIPVVGPVSLSQVHAYGLGYAFPAGREFHLKQDSEGPKGSGALVSSDARALQFEKNEIEWHPIGGGCFLGLQKDKTRRPRARDLQRADSFVDGHHVMLGDKQSWVVPVVRFADGNTSLPCVLRRKDNGEYGYEVASEYRLIYQICDRLVDEAIAGKGLLDAKTTMAFAAGVLQVNYCISEHEIAALELIDTKNVKQVAHAALDMPSMLLLMQEFKKKQNAQSESGPDSATGGNE